MQTINDIKTLLGNYKSSISVYENNLENIQKNQVALEMRYKNSERAAYVVDNLKLSLRVLKDYQRYIKNASIDRLEEALEQVQDVIPNASRLKLHKDKQFYITAQSGDKESPLHLAEGDGLQSLVAFFIITRCLVSATDVLPFCIFDELFAPMSHETSISFSEALKQTAEYMQIIVIEQKDTIAEAGVIKEFVVDIENGRSEIRLEEAE